MTLQIQFIQALNQLCRTRSKKNSDIYWWFSQRDPRAYRVGVDEFPDENTRPVQVA